MVTGGSPSFLLCFLPLGCVIRASLASVLVSEKRLARLPYVVFPVLCDGQAEAPFPPLILLPNEHLETRV